MSYNLLPDVRDQQFLLPPSLHEWVGECSLERFVPDVIDGRDAPPGLEVHWIGRDAILGVWQDELDVEYVHRHRLTRDPAPGDSIGGRWGP